MKMNMQIPLVMVVSPEGCRSMFAASEYRSFREEISRTIFYPDFARRSYLEGVVNVELMTDDNGNIVVNETNATHAGLLDYVMGRIHSLMVSDHESMGKQFRLMLKFMMY